MTNPQQGDVLVVATLDDGDIIEENGVTEMTAGFETLVYFLLFGGNMEDPGGADTTQMWWGNFIEPNTDLHLRSKTQYMLNTLSANSANLKKVNAAVLSDLERLKIYKIANEVNVVSSIPSANRINILIEFTAQGERQSFNFVENWEASA
jgi:hypothetical protein